MQSIFEILYLIGNPGKIFEVESNLLYPKVGTGRLL